MTSAYSFVTSAYCSIYCSEVCIFCYLV